MREATSRSPCGPPARAGKTVKAPDPQVVTIAHPRVPRDQGPYSYDPVADHSAVRARPTPEPPGERARVSVDLGCGPFGEGKDVALRAVVAGGGIGGIAAAVALARAGVDVRVYEQAHQLAEVGAGVSLAPNGLRMLERLGVGEGIGRMGARYVSAQLRFSSGRAVRLR